MYLSVTQESYDVFYYALYCVFSRELALATNHKDHKSWYVVLPRIKQKSKSRILAYKRYRLEFPKNIIIVRK